MADLWKNSILTTHKSIKAEDIVLETSKRYSEEFEYIDPVKTEILQTVVVTTLPSSLHFSKSLHATQSDTQALLKRCLNTTFKNLENTVPNIDVTIAENEIKESFDISKEMWKIVEEGCTALTRAGFLEEDKGSKEYLPVSLSEPISKIIFSEGNIIELSVEATLDCLVSYSSGGCHLSLFEWIPSTDIPTYYLFKVALIYWLAMEAGYSIDKLFLLVLHEPPNSPPRIGVYKHTPCDEVKCSVTIGDMIEAFVKYEIGDGDEEESDDNEETILEEDINDI